MQQKRTSKAIIVTFTIFRELSSLVNEGKIQHVGANKNGYWKVI